VKHATPETLAQLSDLLAALRLRALNERKLGIFYRKGRAWLHIHEHSGEIFADLREGEDFTRYDVTQMETWPLFLQAVDETLKRT